MSWPAGTVPADVTAMRAMILASSTFTGAGGSSSTTHYPVIDATAASFPAVVITRESNERQSYAAGSGGLPTGAFRLDVYCSGLLVGDAEDFANSLALDLAAQTTGLCIRFCRADLASDPEGGERAAIADSDSKAYCVVPIYVQHGVTL